MTKSRDDKIIPCCGKQKQRRQSSNVNITAEIKTGQTRVIGFMLSAVQREGMGV